MFSESPFISWMDESAIDRVGGLRPFFCQVLCRSPSAPQTKSKVLPLACGRGLCLRWMGESKSINNSTPSETLICYLIQNTKFGSIEIKSSSDTKSSDRWPQQFNGDPTPHPAHSKYTQPQHYLARQRRDEKKTSPFSLSLSPFSFLFAFNNNFRSINRKVENITHKFHTIMAFPCSLYFRLTDIIGSRLLK